MPLLRLLRVFAVVAAFGLLALALGLGLRAEWATALWPWTTGRLTFLFLSSIAAAIAVPFLWVAWAEEWGAMRGSALFPLLTSAGTAAYLLGEPSAGAAGQRLAGMAAVGALFSLAMVLVGRRFALRDGRRQPLLVRISFAVFALVLILAGGALVLGRPNVMPWPIDRPGGVICGWVFLGAATGYLYGLLSPAWHNARGPLLGFLVYDLILLPPLLAHFEKVKPEHRTSLVVYVAVLLYSGALAAYQLFFARATRSWRAAPGRGRGPA